MLRFVRLLFLLVSFTAFVFWIVDRADYKMQLGSFIDGLIVAGLTGFTFFWIDGWWSTVTRYEKFTLPDGSGVLIESDKSLAEILRDTKRNGRMLNPDFANYMVLTAVDMPKTVVDSVEIPDTTGPFGAKGTGEVPYLTTAPAIANAIYNAIGIRFREIPITPEKIFMALKAARL